MVLLGLLLLEQAWATDHQGGRNYPEGTGGINAPWQQDKPHLVLISIDGYRWDYPDLYPTPTISRLIAEGQQAERLVPAWPTLTFPNHFTMVTGLPPAEHGLVANDFYDPEMRRWYHIRDRNAVEDGDFYQGEPIWVTAETQGMVAASFFWVGSEADIGDVHPAHWRRFSKEVPGEERVDQVLAWLAEPAQTRPHMITLYFEDVDDHAHSSGPGSPEFLAALQRVDEWLGRLLAGIEALPHNDRVNIVLVSDHGQMPYRDSPPFVLADHLDLDGLTLIDGGPYVFAWQDLPDPLSAAELAEEINTVWRHGKAYTPHTAPAEWGVEGNPRAPQLIFQADPGYAVLSTANKSDKVVAGDHGWAPDTPEMHGIFIAWGPQMPASFTTGTHRATEVHELLLDILGLEPPEP